MEANTESVYKTRAKKTPGGSAIVAKDESVPHQAIELREIKKEIPQRPRWVLTESGWSAQ